jgi:hypothetical protein
MSITGTNLRRGRRTLRRINRNMASSNSKADVFDMDMYRDEAVEDLRRARRRRRFI